MIKGFPEPVRKAYAEAQTRKVESGHSYRLLPAAVAR